MPRTFLVSLKMPAMSRGRAVWIADIAEGDLAALLQPVERGLLGEVVALAVGDRDARV
jgi:hypothetical protein